MFLGVRFVLRRVMVKLVRLQLEDKLHVKVGVVLEYVMGLMAWADV